MFLILFQVYKVLLYIDLLAYRLGFLLHRDYSQVTPDLVGISRQNVVISCSLVNLNRESIFHISLQRKLTAKLFLLIISRDYNFV